MTPVETHLARIFDGEPLTRHTDLDLPELLVDLRRVNGDRRKLEALGRFTLAKISAGLKSSLQAERAVIQARAPGGPDHA